MIVEVVTSRIYCQAASPLGRTPPFSGLVVNGLETHPKSYLWPLPRWGLDSWMTVVSKRGPRTPTGIQGEPLQYGKKTRELLLTGFLTQ